MMPRIFAALLAIGGVFWGSILLIGFVAGGRLAGFPMFAQVFGPGYLAKAGYVIRAVTTPRFAKRMLIWSFSQVVQGAWLVGVGGRSAILSWWGFAVMFSALALPLECFVDDETTNPV